MRHRAPTIHRMPSARQTHTACQALAKHTRHAKRFPTTHRRLLFCSPLLLLCSALLRQALLYQARHPLCCHAAPRCKAVIWKSTHACIVTVSGMQNLPCPVRGKVHSSNILCPPPFAVCSIVTTTPDNTKQDVTQGACAQVLEPWRRVTCSGRDQIHGAAHPLDHLSRDHPIR